MSESLQKIRVRFAPSPTGRLHQGNVRTALYNYLWARQSLGTLVLRMDDTDLARSKEEYILAIQEDLKWLGLKLDEGEGIGGEFQSYRQSERGEIYQKYLSQLLEEGKAYACFTPVEEIELKRKAALKMKQAFVFRSQDRDLPWGEAKARLDAGESAHFRFKVLDEPVDFEDLVYGPKHFEMEKVEDFTLTRSDGSPLYLFVSAIDDALMGITHVVRGEDGISNTPRQILIQQALGWTPPKFAHLPLILGPDRKLLSKRNGSLTVSALREAGYLPEAVLHHLALLGWAPPEPKDCWSLADLVQAFRLEKVSRSPSVMDPEQLKVINHHHLIHLSEEEFLARAKPFVEAAKPDLPEVSEECLSDLVKVLQPNLNTLQELGPWLKRCLVSVDWQESTAQSWRAKPESAQVWQSLLAELKTMSTWDAASVKALMEKTKEQSGQKGKNLFMPIRLALSGVTYGPELKPLLKALGKTFVEKRVQDALKDL